LQTLILKRSIVLAGLFFCLAVPAASPAFFWGDQDLVTINGTGFSTDDYRAWWREWREAEMPVAQSPDAFVDWVLLYQEAQAMELDQNPDYKRKLAVFLKVRSLMQLKQEEVTSHTRMPADKELWDDYIKEHTPIYNLRLVSVNSIEAAEAIRQVLAGGAALSETVKLAGLEKASEVLDATGPLRAEKLPEPIRSALADAIVGQVGGPVFYGHVWYFYEVLDRNDGNETDFSGFKDELIRQALKRQENRLTFELVEFLKKQYQVMVNEDLIAGMTPEGFPEESADQVAVQVGKTMLPVKNLYRAVAKEHALRGSAQRNPENFENTKKRVINEAVIQTVTGLEAINRHYEDRPPLQQTYAFYRQHRLIKELEKTLILPAVKVGDAEAEAEAYYNEHPELFSRGGLVELAMVETKETALAERLEMQLKAGEEFFQVMQPLAPTGVETSRVLVDRLQPVLRKAVEALAPGQVSGAVRDGETIYFLKLIREGEKEFISFTKVAEQILTQLHETRFADDKARLLKQLRSRSTIDVNRSEWNKLKQRLIEEGRADHGV
jgi:parvulin-like peptidyl-prolyl isomerase